MECGYGMEMLIGLNKRHDDNNIALTSTTKELCLRTPAAAAGEEFELVDVIEIGMLFWYTYYYYLLYKFCMQIISRIRSSSVARVSLPAHLPVAAASLPTNLSPWISPIFYTSRFHCSNY